MDFDAIVAGAGAGGAACALYLVRAGLRVLVVELEHLPRYKACGGAIPRQALERLGIPLEKVIRATPEEVCFAYPGLAPVVTPLPGRPVAMVLRSELDACLLAHSGAEVLDGTGVTGIKETGGGVAVEAAGRRLTARYLVGADGAASRVARWLGLRRSRQFGGCLEAEVPLDVGGEIEAAFGRRALFDVGAMAGGYAWVFPKGDCLSVGIGRFRPGQADLRAALKQTMHGLGIQVDGVPLHGHPLPVYQCGERLPGRGAAWPSVGRPAQEKLTTRRCVLVGDAAGLVDPLLGEGIRYAIASGRLAAEAIAGDDLRGYEAAVWREMGHSLATAGLAAAMFYRWPRRCFQLGVRNPAAVQVFAGVLGERTSYEGVAWRLMRTTMGWVVDRHRRGGGRRD